MSPAELQARLGGQVERIESSPQGVLIVATSQLLERDELVSLDERLRSLIGAG